MFVFKGLEVEKRKTVLWQDGYLWCATELAPATDFDTKEEALKAIERSQSKWPKAKFSIE